MGEAKGRLPGTAESFGLAGKGAPDPGPAENYGDEGQQEEGKPHRTMDLPCDISGDIKVGA